jgi:plasmid stabilization system protein ParE
VRIFDHIERDSPQNAPAVIEGVINAIDSLAQFPHRYKVHQSARHPDRVVRSMPVPPYVVYYRVIDQHSVVRVLTVRHGARRQPRRFP